MENRSVRKSVKKHRKRSDTETLLSNPDLTPSEKSETTYGFPPGITVDELFLYRKKKPPAFIQIQDNLKPEEGSFRTIKSEYRRRFREDLYGKNSEEFRGKPKKPEDTLKVEGSLELNPEYYESFIEYPLEKSIVRRPRDLIKEIGMEIENEEEKQDAEEEDLQKESTEPHLGRHYLFKRPTNLKLEGDFYTETENAEKFIEYLLTGRPEIIIKPSTLKMEGEMETKTENRDKYVPYEYQTRPPLYKKTTNLHLEGTLDISTENREKFLPFHISQRAPFLKKNTNLHLEGDLTLQPEYRDAFVEHKDVQRSRPKLPVNNLKSEGAIDTRTEKAEKFVEHQIHPIIPFLRGCDSRKLTLGDDCAVRRAEYREKFVEHPKVERFVPLKPKESLKPEGNMETFTESKTQFVEKSVSRTESRKATNNLCLEGNIDLNPEYRNAYVNFYKDAYGRFGVKKEENEIERRRRRTTTTNLKTEGKLETNPEYKSAFVDFPRQRPSVKKPTGHLHSEGNLSHTTEKREKFVEHPKGSKAQSMKRQTELKLEGPFECQPEYRRAYIDYIIREQIDRQTRPLENTNGQTKRILNGSSSAEVIPAVIEPRSENTTLDVSLATEEGGESSTSLREAKSKLPLPVAPQRKLSGQRTSSVSPVSRSSGKRVSKENVAKMENCLFGPKVPNPSSKLRHTSPGSKRASESERQRIARARRRYGSPVMVENLAYTPRASPVQAIIEASNRRKWKCCEDNSDDQAFVVLSNVKGECNNNAGELKCSKKNHAGYNELLKEQKWMPSWYGRPSK